jgi:hypothetical protein
MIVIIPGTKLLTLRDHMDSSRFFYVGSMFFLFLVFWGVSFFVLCLMLHVSLDCAFLIIPPAFSNVYLINSLISRQQVH